jgi:membrane associated rhomboid family serine protease
MFPLKDSIKIPCAPAVTYFLILVNAAVFLYQDSLSAGQFVAFSQQYGLVPCRYFEPFCGHLHGPGPNDYLAFITGIFLHGNWWHLILNMWTLLIFGASLEGRIGRAGFLSFYLLCGIAASGTHALFNQDSVRPAIGASGAIAGVLGAYAITFPRAKLLILVILIAVKVPAIIYPLIWFAFQIYNGLQYLVSPGTDAGIAWWAHIGGFIAGLALIPFFRLGPDRTYDEEQRRLPPPLPRAPMHEERGWPRGPWD